MGRKRTARTRWPTAKRTCTAVSTSWTLLANGMNSSTGTPALTAMETARHTLNNRVMYRAVGEATARVREGTPVSAALKQTQVFPTLVVQMVRGGDASAKTGPMFAKSADYLESEFEAATQIFLSLLEPLIIIVIGGIVLLIFAAIFLPILQLNTLSF